jgi:hypothetical protein
METSWDQLAAEIASRLAEEKDAILREAVNNHFGHEDWTLDDLKGHVFCIKPQDSGTETYYYDSQILCLIRPITQNFWFIEDYGPIKFGYEYFLPKGD